MSACFVVFIEILYFTFLIVGMKIYNILILKRSMIYNQVSFVLTLNEIQTNPFRY